jgi:hypothetical protein
MRGMPRTLLTGLALVGSVLCGAGCGSARRAVPNSSLAHARAVAYAHAVNLRSGDVRGMSTYGAEAELSAGERAVQLARCGGGFPGWEAGSLRSVRFETPPLSSRSEAVWSAVRLAPSPAAALRALAANRTPRVRTCTARAFGAVGVHRGPLVHESTTVSALPAPLRGVQGTFALRVIHRVFYREANPRPPEHNWRKNSRR